MALQVPECSVVRHDVEPVVGALQGPAGPVATIGAVPDVRLHDPAALSRGRGRTRAANILFGEVRVGIAHRHEHLVLAAGSKSVRVTDLPARGLWAGHSSCTISSISSRRGLEVLGPHPAPFGPVDPGEEGRDHLAQFDQHEVRVPAGLGQRVRPHPQQQLLIALSRAEDPDVGERAGRQQAPQGIEAARPDRLAVGESETPPCSGFSRTTKDCRRSAAAPRRCRTCGPSRRRSGRRAATPGRPGSRW